MKNVKINNLFNLKIVCCIICLGTLYSCGPQIIVRHQDPTHETVTVFIDNEEEDELDYGEETSEHVSRGYHTVLIVPKGKKHCPWTLDGNGLKILVDEEAELTLLTPPDQPGKIKKEAK